MIVQEKLLSSAKFGWFHAKPAKTEHQDANQNRAFTLACSPFSSITGNEEKKQRIISGWFPQEKQVEVKAFPLPRGH